MWITLQTEGCKDKQVKPCWPQIHLTETIDFIPFAAKKGKIVHSSLQLTNTRADGLCTCTLHLHINTLCAFRVRQTSLLVVAVIKAGRQILNRLRFLYSISAQTLSPGLIHSSTTVCRSIQRTIRKERRGKRARENGREKERGLRVKPSPETPLQHSHRERKRKSEVKQEKKWQEAGLPWTKYKAVASERSHYSAVSVCVCAHACNV